MPDLHRPALVHEVTSPQASRACAPPAARCTGRRRRWRWRTTMSPPPTAPRASPRRERIQVETLEQNCASSTSSISRWRYPAGHRSHHRAGAGLHQPGMTIVCGDFAHLDPRRVRALAFGIGTSEVEHVLAPRPDPAPGKNMRVTVEGNVGRASRRRTSCSPSSAASAPPAAPATSSNMPAMRSRPLDGRPHDGVQHVDRSRRQGRPDRTRRDDLRLYQGPADGAGKRVRGSRRSPSGNRCQRSGAKYDTESC